MENNKENKVKVIKPQDGYQERFVTSNVDIVVGGGAAGVGKTSAAVISSGYYVDIKEFRALYVRKNLGELKGGGSMTEEFKKIYPPQVIARTTMSDNPEIEFTSGAKVIMTHMNDESINAITERVKGWQYDFIYLDELTAYQWSTFTYLLSRNRGSSGIRPLFRATTNPKKNSWVRKLVDWYIDEDGFIDPAKDGVIRYMYYAGGGVDEIIWGDSKEEVYARVKDRIDRQMKASGTEFMSPYDFIKSFTFIKGKLGENKILLKDQPQYLGNLAMSGGAQADQLLEGNWNVDEEEDMELPITREMAASVFNVDPNPSGKRYITADIAMGGEDNTVILAWEGFHVLDATIVAGKGLDSPMVISLIRNMQAKHSIGDFNVIYDSIGQGNFVGGYIRGAIAYNSNRAPLGQGKARYYHMKTQCAEKIIELIKYGVFSIDPSVANRIYKHRSIKKVITFKEEFITECSVIRFYPPLDNGKLRVIEKADMCRLLGKNRSPDILDNFIMRVSVDLDYNTFNYADRGFDVSVSRGINEAFEETDITLQEFLEWA